MSGGTEAISTTERTKSDMNNNYLKRIDMRPSSTTLDTETTGDSAYKIYSRLARINDEHIVHSIYPESSVVARGAFTVDYGGQGLGSSRPSRSLSSTVNWTLIFKPHQGADLIGDNAKRPEPLTWLEAKAYQALDQVKLEEQTRKCYTKKSPFNKVGLWFRSCCSCGCARHAKNRENPRVSMLRKNEIAAADQDSVELKRLITAADPSESQIPLDVNCSTVRAQVHSTGSKETSDNCSASSSLSLRSHDTVRARTPRTEPSRATRSRVSKIPILYKLRDTVLVDNEEHSSDDEERYVEIDIGRGGADIDGEEKVVDLNITQFRENSRRVLNTMMVNNLRDEVGNRMCPLCFSPLENKQ